MRTPSRQAGSRDRHHIDAKARHAGADGSEGALPCVGGPQQRRRQRGRRATQLAGAEDRRARRVQALDEDVVGGAQVDWCHQAGGRWWTAAERLGGGLSAQPQGAVLVRPRRPRCEREDQ